MPARLPRPVYFAIGRASRSRIIRRPHAALYGRFHGAAFLGHSMGCLTILLHTTGAKSGRPRTAPLFGFPTDENGRGAGGPQPIAVVASNGGRGHPPAWYWNLAAHPGAVVEEGSDRWGVRARVADGAERERLWRAITAAYAGYDDYQAVTVDEIPVVVLEPLAQG